MPKSNTKSKPQPAPQPLGRMLALNNAGVNELAAYLGCTNWFAEELVRQGRIPHVVMGDRKVVDSKDADVWVDLFKNLEPHRQEIRQQVEALRVRIKKEYPDKKIRELMEVVTFPSEEQAILFYGSVDADEEGNIIWGDEEKSKNEE